MNDKETKDTSHDVFISYASDKGDSTGSKDRQTADMICSGLEAEGIRCWIAPRDILPGEDWLDAIIDAIEKSKVVVLIFSANANSSKWVKDEIKLALDLDIKIIPFQIDDVSPQRGLKILKARSQWLAAYRPPLENHLDKLIEAVRSNLEKKPEKPSEIIKKQTEAVKEGVKAEVDRKEKILMYKKWILYAVPVIILIALSILYKDGLLIKKSTPGNNNASGKSITGKITDKDADKKKNDLEKQDDQDFKSALAQNTISAYQGYIKKFPNGRHVNDAEYKIKKLEDLPADVKNVELKGIKVRINEKDYWEADFKEYDIIMVYIPESDFIMGSNDGDKDEKPRHKKHLNGYWMGKTEITNAQFVKFLNDSEIDHKNGCDGKKCIKTNEEDQDSHIKGSYGNYLVEPGYENYPVVEVSWYGAVRYCKWLSQETGQKFKLPTEAQWEKAARGTDNRTYPWGNKEPNKKLANFNADIGKTSPVDSYPQGASFYGLLNMAGNVREWCRDMYSPDYSKKTISINQNGLNNSDRVIRGGSWNNNAANIRCSRRSRYNPSVCDYDVSFRLCMENR